MGLTLQNSTQVSLHRTLSKLWRSGRLKVSQLYRKKYTLNVEKLAQIVPIKEGAQYVVVTFGQNLHLRRKGAPKINGLIKE